MRADSWPFLALGDVRLDFPPPAHGEPLSLGLFRIVIQDINVALKISDSDEFLATVAIHVGQAEPAVGAAVVIAKLGFFAARGAVKNHYAIMGGDADLRHAIAVE